MYKEFHSVVKTDPASKFNLLTYLCGTTTNTWLGPVEEDQSMPVLSPPGLMSFLISPSIVVGIRVF
jgi:hypothetical protein